MSTGACHTPAAQAPAVQPPWAGDPRADDKDALLAYALENPDGIRLSRVARARLDTGAENGDRHDKLARRFYTKDHPEGYAHLFKTDRRDGHVWVEPRQAAALLKSSRQDPSLADAEKPNRPTGPGCLPARAPGGRAAQTARSILRDRCQVTPGPRGAGVRSALEHALAAHREGVDQMRPDRVSSPSRVARLQGTYLTAFEAAATEGYTEATLLGLTPRVGSHGDALDGAIAVAESIGPLRDHLARQTPGTGRPDAVIVPHVGRQGLVHLHVVVFGVTPDRLDPDALTDFWHGTHGHGYINDVAPVERRAGRWVFADHADAGTDRGRYIRAYLGEQLHQARAVAEATPDDLHAGRVAGAWRVAVLWAAGLPLVTVSTALEESPVRLDARTVLLALLRLVVAALRWPRDSPDRRGGSVGRGKPPPGVSGG